jgi:hypothetical protein
MVGNSPTSTVQLWFVWAYKDFLVHVLELRPISTIPHIYLSQSILSIVLPLFVCIYDVFDKFVRIRKHWFDNIAQPWTLVTHASESEAEHRELRGEATWMEDHWKFVNERHIKKTLLRYEATSYINERREYFTILP